MGQAVTCFQSNNGFSGLLGDQELQLLYFAGGGATVALTATPQQDHPLMRLTGHLNHLVISSH